MAQWTLTDYSTGSPVVFTFPINPNQFTHPNKTAKIKSEQTVATTGSVVLFMGRPEMPKLSFKGVIRTEQFYNDMVTWTDKWNPLELADDEGTTWSIVISDFRPERLKSATNQWRFSYTVDALVVE